VSDISGTSALIPDIDRRKALPIIRALGKSGVRVLGLSSHRAPMGWFSKYCAKTFRCPDYRDEPDAFLEYLSDVCRTQKPDVLYPIEDVSLDLCVRHPQFWQPFTSALLPSPDALERTYDNWQTLQTAKACGIPAPESFCPQSLAEVADLGRSRQGPWIIKPRKGSGSRGLQYVEHHNDLETCYRKVASQYPSPIIQERIPAGGQGVGVSFLLDRCSQPLAIFCHRRLREYPISGGPSTLRVSFRDDRLIEQSLRLLTALNFTGVAMVEYKLDTRTGEYVLMEVNPRFWGSLPLAIHAGVNFPVLYHRASLGLAVVPVLEYTLGLYGRWLWPGDLLHFIANPERFRLNPSFFQFWRPDTADDILSADDLWPTVGILVEALRKLVSRDR